MFVKHSYMHTLKDGADLPGAGELGEDAPDRGDLVEGKKEKELTDEEKAAAAKELKDAEDAEAKKKADEEAKKKKGEGSEEDDEPDEVKRKDNRIPLKRHKEILEEERTARLKAEAKLAQYERSEDISKTNEELTKAEERLLGMMEEYNKLLVDGKVDDANKRMAEIRKLDRDIADIKGDLKAAAAESRAYERARYDTTVERIESAYPQLNEDNKNHDDPEKRFRPELVAKVLRVSRAYQQDGMPPAQALQDAVKDLIGDPVTAKQKEAVDVKARVDDADVKKAARDEEVRRKAAEAASKQPPSMKGAGKDADKMGGKGGASLTGEDVMQMSYEQFAKLDQDTLSRLRGDVAA